MMVLFIPKSFINGHRPNGCQLCCYLEIWDALRGAAEADVSLAQVIVDSAGVIVTTSDLTTCYDERGIV